MYVVRCKLKLHVDCIEESYAATEHQCTAQKSAQARPQYSMNVLVYPGILLIVTCTSLSRHIIDCDMY